MELVDWILANITATASTLAIGVPIGAGWWVNNRFKQQPDIIRYALTSAGVIAALALCSLSAKLFGFPDPVI